VGSSRDQHAALWHRLDRTHDREHGAVGRPQPGHGRAWLQVDFEACEGLARPAPLRPPGDARAASGGELLQPQVLEHAQRGIRARS